MTLKQRHDSPCHYKADLWPIHLLSRRVHLSNLSRCSLWVGAATRASNCIQRRFRCSDSPCRQRSHFTAFWLSVYRAGSFASSATLSIFRTLFVQSRGAVKKELLEHLWRTIQERPAAAEDSAVPGHWAGDLLCGSGNSQIATLVERSTRYAILVKVDRKDTQRVVDALIRTVRKLPNELFKSLTWDRRKEMADHRRFTLATDIQVYFCDPQSPWQRGSKENSNGWLSQ